MNLLATLTWLFFDSRGSESLREGFCFDRYVRYIQFTGSLDHMAVDACRRQPKFQRFMRDETGAPRAKACPLISGVVRATSQRFAGAARLMVSDGRLKVRPILPIRNKSPLSASSCRPSANLTKDLIMIFLKQLKRFALGIAATTLLFCGPAMAAEKGTAAEAEAMVTKAVAHIKKVGAEKAYSDFTNLAEWKPKDLYIFVNDLNSGVSMAHGANAKMVGKEVRELKDPDGKFPNKVIEEVVKTKGKGWGTEIKFMNPVTKQMAPRKVYAERVGDTLVACGIFLD